MRHLFTLLSSALLMLPLCAQAASPAPASQPATQSNTFNTTTFLNTQLQSNRDYNGPTVDFDKPAAPAAAQVAPGDPDDPIAYTNGALTKINNQ